MKRLYPDFGAGTKWSIAGSAQSHFGAPPAELVALLRAFYATHDDKLFAMVGQRWW